MDQNGCAYPQTVLARQAAGCEDLEDSEAYCRSVASKSIVAWSVAWTSAKGKKASHSTRLILGQPSPRLRYPVRVPHVPRWLRDLARTGEATQLKDLTFRSGGCKAVASVLHPRSCLEGDDIAIAVALEDEPTRAKRGTGPARTPHGASNMAHPTGHASPQVVGPQGVIGRSRRIGSVPEGYADLSRRPCLRNPHEKGTGGKRCRFSNSSCSPSSGLRSWPRALHCPIPFGLATNRIADGNTYSLQSCNP
jgi:hypothetical protein